MKRTMAWLAAVALTGCGGVGATEVPLPAPAEDVENLPPGEDKDPSGGGDEDPVTGNSGGDTGPKAPRCAELSAQGLLCHDGWCWDLGGHQGNSLAASVSSGTEVWAVGTMGTIVHWDGRRWEREVSGTLAPLSAVDEAGGDVWAVGSGGVVLHRGTAGRWEMVRGPGFEDFFDVEVTAPGEVWVASARGVARYHAGKWSWVLTRERQLPAYDLWSTGPEDVWVLGGTVARWDGTAFREVDARFSGGRLGGSEPGRPFIALGNAVHQWNGSAFEERFVLDNDTFGIDFLSQRGGGLWVFASRGGGGSGLDDGRLVLRWDGQALHTVWSETFGTHADDVKGMPRSLALLDDGTAFLMGERGRTLRWNGGTWSEPPRVPGVTATLLPMGPRDIWAMEWSKWPGVSGLHWDGTAWKDVPVRGLAHTGRFTATAPDDVWVTGDGLNHWDGGRWTRYEEPGPVSGILAVARDDVWVTRRDGIVSRWRGSGWTDVPTGTASFFETLWASGANDVWAGGTTLIRWNGSTWERVPGISPSETLQIGSISGTGPDNVWVGGNRVLHWDGKALHRVEPPAGSGGCGRVWSGGPGTLYATCGFTFYQRVDTGWRELPFESMPSAIAGTPQLGYAVVGDALLRFCEE